MAAACAGSKRTFNQMRGYPSDRDHSPHTLSSPRYSRASSSSAAVSRTAKDVGEIVPSTSAAATTTTTTRKTTFDRDVSIVLVGIRGVGKSSLSILAATAYNRKVVESERQFLESTGVSPSAYRRAHGAEGYRKRHEHIFRSMLDSYTKGHIIVCTLSDLEDTGLSALEQYSQTHPVVHVTRDFHGVHSHLEAWPEKRIKDILRTSGPILRKCSNFEFFNLSGDWPTEDADCGASDNYRIGASGHMTLNQPHLTLKRVERDFLRLLRSIIGDHGRGISHRSVYPLSNISVETREHTFAVVLKMKDASTVEFDSLQIGADCIELIIEPADCDFDGVLEKAASAFAVVRRNSILPIIMSIGPHSKDEDRLELAKYCLRMGPEYLKVDLRFDDDRLRQVINQKGQSKIIGIYSDLGTAELSADNKYAEEYTRAVRLGCDIVKITSSTATNDGLAEFLSLEKHADNLTQVPLIAYKTGPHGRTSKCFNRVLTPVTYTPTGNVAENEDVTAEELTKALFSNFVWEPMKFLIYGANVSYSLSPAMHNAAYQACGMPHVYEPFSYDSLDGLLRTMKSRDFGGAAITQPFKTSILPLLDAVSSHTQAIGAVNTVVPIRELAADRFHPDDLGSVIKQCSRRGEVKALYGYNTDWIGMRACIRKSLSPANAVRSRSSGLVCGAGGMGRAGIYALISLGVRNIFIYNRTLSTAKVLAENFNGLLRAGDKCEHQAAGTEVRVLESLEAEWPEDVQQPTMIISCIPVQTAGGSPIDFSLPSSWLQSRTGGVVVEVAYGRASTPLVEQVRGLAQRGWIVQDGYDLLPEQAFSQFELFTGRRAPRHVIREEVLKHYRQLENMQT